MKEKERKDREREEERKERGNVGLRAKGRRQIKQDKENLVLHHLQE